MIRIVIICLVVFVPTELWAQKTTLDIPSPNQCESALLIHNVEFANVGKNGKIIDDYGSEISGAHVKYLAQRMVYVAQKPGEAVTLNVRLIGPREIVMRKANSPDGFSYSVTLITAENDLIQTIEIGKWKGKFGKDYMMEIYDGAILLYRDKIPTRGWISHIPVLKRAGVPISREDRRNIRRPSPVVYERLYRQGYTGPWGEYHEIVGWREIEK